MTAILVAIVSISTGAAFGSSDDLSEEVAKRVGEFLQTVGVEPDEIASGKANVSSKTDVEGVRILGINSNEWLLMVEGTTGKVYRFTLKNVPYAMKGGTTPMTYADAIGPKDAFLSFLPIADALGLPRTAEEYEIVFIDLGERDEKQAGPKDLYGCEYSISRDFRYEGIPCRDYGKDRGILARISASTGKVTSLLYKPMLIPGTIAGDVTKDAAEESVELWLSNEPYFSSSERRQARLLENTSRSIELVVACPNDFPSKGKSLAEQVAAETSYYCWEVPFEYLEGEHWFPAMGWVDTNSGVVIGGKRDRSIEP